MDSFITLPPPGAGDVIGSLPISQGVHGWKWHTYETYESYDISLLTPLFVAYRRRTADISFFFYNYPDTP